MIKRILVGLGSLVYAHSATAKAIRLAKTLDAKLTGVTLYDTGRIEHVGRTSIGAGHLAKELKDSRMDDVSGVIAAAELHFAMACEKAGVEYDLRRETGDPLAALVSLTRYHDLVLCGLQSLFEHGVVDEPPDELAILVREGVRPLLAVSYEDRPIKRVLISYSGSMESAKTMRRYVHFQLWPKAEHKIVTFHTDYDAGMERLEDAASYCRDHGLNPEIECVTMSPKLNLLPYANAWGADLIVMGNSAKRMMLRRILGDTALHVMRNAEVPLFLAQ